MSQLSQGRENLNIYLHMKTNLHNTEKWLERELVRKIEARGGLALKYSNGQATGYPDRLVLLPGGRLVFVELKTKGRKPTKLQALRHEALRRIGFTVYVIDCVDALNVFLLGTL